VKFVVFIFSKIIPFQNFCMKLLSALHCLVLHVCCQAIFSAGCHPRVGLSFAEVPAGYLLWCQCTAELHVLNDRYNTGILIGTYRCILIDEITCQWQSACYMLADSRAAANELFTTRVLVRVP